MGTTTSRASHFFPNLAQVPASNAPYGKQCRALFGFSKGRIQVGADASGLELRGLGHYLAPHDGGKYASIVVGGDVHWLNAEVLGFAEAGEARCLDKVNPLYDLHSMIREHAAKRFIYAYIYGCWDEQAGIIILDACNAIKRANPEWDHFHKRFFPNGPNNRQIKKVGKWARERFLTRIDGFADLKEKLKAQVDKYGWVPGLDGRRVPVRSDHSALNFLIQSAGAIICKRWIVDAMAELRARYKEGWDGDFVLMLWVHDEVQLSVREGLEHEIGEVLVRHAKAAGEPYGFRTELGSEYKVGRTWLDTH
jgi:DNA polymerase I-like protein with 3'-5' exonuclease and polymerase domains